MLLFIYLFIYIYFENKKFLWLKYFCGVRIYVISSIQVFSIKFEGEKDYALYIYTHIHK